MSSVFNRWKRPYKTHRKTVKPEVDDSKLWKVFSLYVRLFYADDQGIEKCFTCNRRAHYKMMQCGHGIPAHHLETKYEIKNNHPQCPTCNGPEGGMREVYKEEMDKKYGEGTWDLILLRSRNLCRRSQFEVDELEKFYKAEVIRLKQQKGIV